MQNAFDYTMIGAVESEMANSCQRFCQHTGKPLEPISGKEYAEVVKIHGEDAALTIFGKLQKSYAPEWLWQDSQSLAKLAVWQPKEYCIFVLSKLMVPTIEKEVLALDSFAKAFTDLKDIEMPSGLRNDHKEFDEFEMKKAAWQNLRNVDDEVCRPVSEIARRILAKCKPHYLYKVLAKCSFVDVEEATRSLEALGKMQLELQNVLTWLIENANELEDEAINGLQNFKGQRMLMGLTKEEREIMMELNNFTVIPGKSAEYVEAFLGTSKKKPEKKQKLKYASAPVSVQCSTDKPAPRIKFGFAKKTGE